MEQKAKMQAFLSCFYRYRLWILLGLIFCFHIFLRFYDLENKSSFAWDQVNNAWAAKNIIIDHKFPLLGMVAKGNSGFSIGPAYYYLIVPVYWFFNLDPIAAGFMAGLTSIVTFFVIFFLIKKMFSFPVALISVFIHTVSFYILLFDRNQWPVNFIAPFSLIVFYCLYMILLGNVKYIFFLALAIGFLFNIHFTAIYFIFITLFTLPFFPRTKKTVAFIFLSIPLFFIWIVPNLIIELFGRVQESKNFLSYMQTYSHGFHLKRFLQLTDDAFIEMQGILSFKILKYIEIWLFPLFFFFYYRSIKDVKKVFAIIYLIILWILVPWIVFTIYSGEISNYYFSSTRPIMLMILSYLIWEVFRIRMFLLKIIVMSCLIYYAVYNVNVFFQSTPEGIAVHRESVLNNIRRGIHVGFQEGSPDSYLYYIYTRNK